MTRLVFRGSNQVRHKPACTVTEDGYMLEISDLRRGGIVPSCSENKTADQLCSYCTADLSLFSLRQEDQFSQDAGHGLYNVHAVMVFL